MAIKYLAPSDAPGLSVSATARVSASAGFAATISFPKFARFLYVETPTLSSNTFKVTQKAPDGVGGTAVNLVECVTGTAKFPLAAFTGNRLFRFAPMPGATVFLAASGAAGMLRVQAVK